MQLTNVSLSLSLFKKAEVDVSPVPYLLQYCMGLESCDIQCAENQTFIITRAGGLMGFGNCSHNQIGLRTESREVPAEFVSRRPMQVQGISGPVCSLSVCGAGGAAIVHNTETNVREVFVWGEGLSVSGNTERVAVVPDGVLLSATVGGGMGICIVITTNMSAKVNKTVAPPDVPYPFLDGVRTMKMISMAKKSRSSQTIFAAYLTFALSHPVSLNASCLHPTQRFKMSGLVSGLDLGQVRAVFIEIQVGTVVVVLFCLCF